MPPARARRIEQVDGPRICHNLALAFDSRMRERRLSMKKITLLFAPFFCLALAHADWTIEQKIESPFMNGVSTTSIKGDVMRVDTPMPGGAGQVSQIIDFGKGKATTLMHAQKMAMQMDLATLRNAAQAAVKQNPALAGAAGTPAVKPKPTGSEKVGEWNTDIYEITAAGIPMRLWVAKDFPKAAELKEAMMKGAKAMGAGSPGMPDPSQFDLPGMAVKTEVTTPAGKITSTLVKATEGPIDDGKFAVPADYQNMAMPNLKPPGGEAAPVPPIAPTVPPPTLPKGAAQPK